METPKTIGRYEIVDELGQGAMGSVFRAHDPSMDRMVALKTILLGALLGAHGEEFRKRFYREARAAGALAHPGIVPVFDVGEHEGQPYLVMEYVNGRTLDDKMKKGERVSMDRVCEIGQQLAEALGHAHRKGVVHRDIKPANILMTNAEAYGIERPRITDFGVAKMTAGEITTTGQMLGTPAFMPPEQFTGAPIDGRTDLFSLGVILYWMATGEQPFPGETMTTVSYKIVHTEPVPPARLNPLVPALLDKVILKCLSKSPADRYQSGEELAQALHDVRTGATPASLQTVVPEATMGGNDENATLAATPSLRPRPMTSSGQGQGAAAAFGIKPLTSADVPPAKKPTGMLATVAALLLAAAAGGWFLLHNRSLPPAPPAPPAQLSQSTPAPAVSQPAAAPTQPVAPPTASAAGQKPSAGIQTKPPVQSSGGANKASSGSAPDKTQSSNVAAQAAPTPTHPRMAPVAFNPADLDPRENTRLRLDLSHIPPGTAFQIEMNGKLYLRSSVGNRADYDMLFVPPGVQEFRVIMGSGSSEKTSNTASAEFVAKKRMVLRVDFDSRQIVLHPPRLQDRSWWER
jgi:serine/threonine-protein kinase